MFLSACCLYLYPGIVANRLKRVAITFHVIVQQLDILETMSPLDFLDFREFLFPASGFQVQTVNH
jgi:tryptophan 2,3-dioxygenase